MTGRSLGRLHRLATRAWLALAVGAGFGFVARDLVGIRPPAAGVVWLAGALVGFFGIGRS